MPMDIALRRTLTETAYYATTSSVSDDGDPVYSSPAAFTCRTEVDRVFHGPMFVPRHGESEESNILIFTEVDVPTDAIIWLPGVSTSSSVLARRPKRREITRDPEGAISHYEIYI